MPIRILALAFFFPMLVACHEQQNESQLQATTVGFKAQATNSVILENTKPSASNVIFQSIDGGKTWQDVGAGLPKDVESGKLFTSGDQLFFNTAYGLYHSVSPSSQTWQKEMFPDKRIEEIFPGKTSLYGYTQGVGFFTEMQGSGIWIAIGNTLEGRAVRTLVEAPDGSVLVGSDTGIYKSTDGCKTWKQVFKGYMVTSIIFSNNFLFAGGIDGLLRSSDDGGHWDLIHAQDGRALQIGNIDGGITAIFTGVTPFKDAHKAKMDNSLLFSMDGGETWKPLDVNLPSNQVVSSVVEIGDDLYCSLDSGIYRSTDRGNSWQLIRATKDKERFDLVASGKSVFAIRQFGGC
jgi:hypothetical protein